VIVRIHDKERTFVENCTSNIPVFDEHCDSGAMKYIIEALWANIREGSASTKIRSDVSNGGKKSFGEKGMRHTRQDSNRSSLMQDGNIIFRLGPRFNSKDKEEGRKLALA
jgi:large subunit ribosomal protein L4